MYNTRMSTEHVFNKLQCLLLGLFLLHSASAQATAGGPHTAPPQSILFIGNSFTFYNNAVYTHLRKLLIADDPATRQSIFLKSMTVSGAVLSDHRGGLTQLLDARDWDVVVLQGHSREATDEAKLEGFASTLREFTRAIRAKGAEPVLFMTWAYADQPGMTPGLASAYARLGEDLNARVAPVGLAFARAAEDIPGVRLHDADKVHPSLEGTYLAAAVFYATLYGESPVGLEYAAGLDDALARQLRAVAWRTVQLYSD